MHPTMTLTIKQENFCQAIVDGLSQSDAYRAAYEAGNMSDNAIAVEASRLMDNPNVSLRVDELREDLEALRLWSRAKSLKVLAEVANQSDKGSERVSAVKELNAMQGYIAPLKSESVVRQSIEVVFKSAN